MKWIKSPRSFCALVFWGVVLVYIVALASCTPRSPSYRVGILAGLQYIARGADGFRAGMEELGYVEGKNITYDVRLTDFDPEAYREALWDFVAAPVDLIFAFPTEAALEAKAITQGTDIPVVFSMAMVEETGLVDNLKKPGGNITGVRFPNPESVLKRFEILLQLAPQTQRLLIPYQKGYPGVVNQLQVLSSVAQARGVAIREIPAADAHELEIQLQAMEAAGDIQPTDAFFYLNEPLTVQADSFLVFAKVADRHRIPVGGGYLNVEGYRSLFGVTIDPFASGRMAAFLADKILRGSPAGSLPVITADLYIQIDLGVAQKLGLSVPESLLVEADEIIQ